MRRRPTGRALLEAILPTLLLPTLLLFIGVGLISSSPLGAQTFIRGDVSENGVVNLPDAILGLSYLSAEAGTVTASEEAMDVNDNGVAEVADMARLLAFVFGQQLPPPPPPFPTAGVDPTPPSFPTTPSGNITFTLANVTACAGDIVSVPLSMTNTVAVEGIQARLTYDPAMLTPLEVDTTPYELALGTTPEFSYAFPEPGVLGVVLLFSIGDPLGGAIPPQADLPVVAFTFGVGGGLAFGVSTPIGLFDDLAEPFIFANLASVGGEVQLASTVGGIVTGNCAATEFLRGDFDQSGALTVTDAVQMIAYLFQGGAPPGCSAAADANDNGSLEIGDPITLIERLFAGGLPLAPPYPDCGLPLTTTALDCETSTFACP